MKKLAVLAVATIASQAVVSFAGPPAPKEVVPAPPPPPVSYFRPNEFDIGAFATYATWTGNNPTGTSTRFNRFPRFRPKPSPLPSPATSPPAVGAAGWTSLIGSRGNT